MAAPFNMPDEFVQGRMYLENNRRKAGRLSGCGTPVDLGSIDMPSYIFGTQEDHIVPWKGAYRST